jgi:hypothetical protein
MNPRVLKLCAWSGIALPDVVAMAAEIARLRTEMDLLKASH